MVVARLLHLIFLRKILARKPATFHIQARYLQAKKPNAQSSTFHFFRASKNKKSLPFPNAHSEQISELNRNFKKCP